MRAHSTPVRLLLDPSVSPLALVYLLNNKYKTLWLTMEIEALWHALSEDVCVPEDIVKEKIRALRVCNGTTAPWERFEVFAPVVQAFNGVTPTFNRHVVMDAHELALALVVMHTVRVEEVGEEVRKYIAASLMMRGLHFPPIDVLRCARDFFTPYDTSAENFFTLIKNVPIHDVEIHADTQDAYQAAIARAELEAFTTTRERWKEQERGAQ